MKNYTKVIHYGLLLMVLVLAHTGNAQPTERTIHFSGFDWKPLSCELCMPGPNRFSESTDNIWLDSLQRLHLKITHRGNKWYAAEVRTTKTDFHYGTYRWKIIAPVGQFDPNAGFGLYTYDSQNFASDSHSEIDIEFSRFGKKENPNLTYSVQPTHGGLFPERCQAYNFPRNWSNHSQHEFIWTDSIVSFRSTPLSNSDSILSQSDSTRSFEWSYVAAGKPPRQGYPGNDFTGEKSSAPIRIPRPGPDTRVWITVSLFNPGIPKGSLHPYDGREVEVIIESFEYIPYEKSK